MYEACAVTCVPALGRRMAVLLQHCSVPCLHHPRFSLETQNCVLTRQHAGLSRRMPCNAATTGAARVSEAGFAHLIAAGLRNAARASSMQSPGMLAY